MVLLGRGRERTACRAALVDGASPSGVVIVGEPGVGKTALLRSVARDAAASGRRVLHTTGLPGEVDVSLANLADLLDRAAPEVLSELPAVQADALGAALRLGRVRGPLDESIVSRGLVNALRALARRRPVVIAIDDAHWLDSDTRHLLCIAAAWITDAPVAWLLSVRTSHDLERLVQVVSHELADHSIRLDLQALDAGSLGQLIADRFPGPWSPTLVRRIIALSDGNAYTALELARETIARGGFHDSDARIPGTLARSLNARLHRLETPVLQMVQTVAVMARPSRPLLRSLARSEADDADAAVDAAIDAGVLQVVTGKAVLRCTHPLLQQIAILTMGTRRRRHLHRRLAAAIRDPDEAALHLAAGTDEPSEAAASSLEAAAIRLLDAGLPTRASDLAEAALRLTPGTRSDEVWLRRLLVLRSLVAVHDLPRGRSLADSWSRETPPEYLRGHFSVIYASFSDMETRFQLLARAVGELAGEPRAAAYAGARLASCLVTEAWRIEEARVHAEQAVLAAQDCGEPDILSWALSVVADVASRDGDPDAGRLLHDAVSLQEEHGEPQPWMAAHDALIDWHMRRGELAPARELADVLYEASERSGQRGGAAQWNYMQIEWLQGNWAAADEHAERFLQIARFNDSNATAAAIATCLVHMAHTPMPQMRDELSDCIRLAQSLQDSSAEVLLRGLAGDFELSIDDPAAAAAWLDPVAAVLGKRTFVEFLMPTFEGDLIECWLRLDRHDEAVERLSRLKEGAQQRDDSWATIVSQHCDAVRYLSEGEPGAAVEAVEPATVMARELGLKLELGRSLVVLGRALRRARRRRDAAASLDDAIATFQDLRATHWLAQARAERAKLDHSAPTLLTATELRITKLVAAGHSNAEIAAALQLKEKTVESNLTRIYRKLGVRNRVQLTRAAAAGVIPLQRS